MSPVSNSCCEDPLLRIVVAFLAPQKRNLIGLTETTTLNWK